MVNPQILEHLKVLHLELENWHGVLMILISLLVVQMTALNYGSGIQRYALVTHCFSCEAGGIGSQTDN